MNDMFITYLKTVFTVLALIGAIAFIKLGLSWIKSKLFGGQPKEVKR